MRFPIGAFLLTIAFQLPAHAENVIVLNSADVSVTLIDEATQKVGRYLPGRKGIPPFDGAPDNQPLIVANYGANDRAPLI
ncbi:MULTISPECIES: hypothetical protein [Paraburkholderia]|uniref:hypothetical protein n=1 Tax=Paraburkholderia TaxID=1822464 RepID=UPI0038BCCCC5